MRPPHRAVDVLVERAGLALSVVLNVAGFAAASNALVAVSWAILLVAMSCIGRAAVAGGARLTADGAAPLRTHA